MSELLCRCPDFLSFLKGFQVGKAGCALAGTGGTQFLQDEAGWLCSGQAGDRRDARTTTTRRLVGYICLLAIALLSYFRKRENLNSGWQRPISTIYE